MFQSITSFGARVGLKTRGVLKSIKNLVSLNTLIGFSSPNLPILVAIMTIFYLGFLPYLSTQATLNEFLVNSYGITYDMFSVVLVMFALIISGCADAITAYKKGERISSMATFVLKNTLLPFRFAKKTTSEGAQKTQFVINSQFFAIAVIILFGAGTVTGTLLAFMLMLEALFRNNYCFWQLSQPTSDAALESVQNNDQDCHKKQEEYFIEASRYFYYPVTWIVTVAAVAFSILGPNLIFGKSVSLAHETRNNILTQVFTSATQQHPLGKYPLQTDWFLTCRQNQNLTLASMARLNNSAPGKSQWSKVFVKLGDSCPTSGLAIPDTFDPKTAKVTFSIKTHDYLIARYIPGDGKKSQTFAEYFNYVSDARYISFYGVWAQKNFDDKTNSPETQKRLSDAIKLALDFHAVSLSTKNAQYTQPYTAVLSKTSSQGTTLNSNTPKVPVVAPNLNTSIPVQKTAKALTTTAK